MNINGYFQGVNRTLKGKEKVWSMCGYAGTCRRKGTEILAYVNDCGIWKWLNLSTYSGEYITDDNQVLTGNAIAEYIWTNHNVTEENTSPKSVRAALSMYSDDIPVDVYTELVTAIANLSSNPKDFAKDCGVMI